MKLNLSRETKNSKLLKLIKCVVEMKNHFGKTLVRLRLFHYFITFSRYL